MEIIIGTGLIAALVILLHGACLIVQDKQRAWESNNKNKEEKDEQDNY